MKLHAQVYGEGPVLIILHGLFGSGDNWASLAKRYGEHFEVHCLDQRNHGRSPHHPEHSYQAMAEDLGEYLDDHGLDKVCIIGHSMGGKAAMFFATDFPNRVERLLVADIGPWSYPVHHASIIQAMKALRPWEYQRRSEVEDAFAQSGLDAATRMFLLKSIYREQGVFAWRFNLEGLEREIEKVGQALPDSTIFEGPSLFLRGGLSPYVPEERYPEVLKHFPQATFGAIPKAGHWLHAEAPDAFFEQSMPFLSNP
jgi:esterase